MKRRRHGPEQIIAELREADAMLAAGASIGQPSRVRCADHLADAMGQSRSARPHPKH